MIAGLETPDAGQVEDRRRRRRRVRPQRRGVGFVFQHYAAVQAHDRRGQRRVRADDPSGARRRRSASGCRSCSGSSSSTGWRSATRRSSRAASGSGWRSRGRSRSSPRCCSWTSRSARSTHASARSCARGSATCTTEPTSRRCSSRTTRRRRWTSPTRSSCMNGGRVEQVGSPHDLYEQPASEFVMSFVGPVNRLGDALVRPHDVELSLAPADGAEEAMVDRVVRLGFEVRVELVRRRRRAARGAADARRGGAGSGSSAGQTVYVRATREKRLPAERQGRPDVSARTPRLRLGGEALRLLREVRRRRGRRASSSRAPTAGTPARRSRRLQVLRGARVRDVLRRLAVDVRDRPLERAEDVRERDLLGRPREPVAADRRRAGSRRSRRGAGRAGCSRGTSPGSSCAAASRSPLIGPSPAAAASSAHARSA